MENSEDNEYSAAFVDGVIRDYMARKKKNTNNVDAYNNRVITRMAGANPGAAPANNNQRAAGREIITDGDIAGKQRNGQTNYNQYSDNNPVNNLNVMFPILHPKGLMVQRPKVPDNVFTPPDKEPPERGEYCDDGYEKGMKDCLSSKDPMCRENVREKWGIGCGAWQTAPPTKK
jgi:hypothetical protein